MQVFRSLDEVPANFGPTVVSVGNFDGVHLAHQAGRAATWQSAPTPSEARPWSSRSSRIRLRILRPDVAPRLLDAAPAQAEAAGADQSGCRAGAAVHARPVADDGARLCAKMCWPETLHAREVHEGYNFHFGHKAQGNMNTLGALGEELGFEREDLSRAASARASRLEQRDSQADRRRRGGTSARVAGSAVQHHLQSRSRPRLRDASTPCPP